jgi:NADH dehydrogenase/NADH:ubiquinone oxidoreductase subunit G
MSAEQVREQENQENAENRNGAIDESGKVDRIRDILFGSQMRDYDGRFQRLDERLEREAADARADMQKRLEALESFLKGAVESLSNRLNTEQSERGSAVEKLGRDLAETARTLELATKNLGEHAGREVHVLRQQLLDQSKALSDEIREKHDQMKGHLDREAEQIRGAMTGREALGEMLSEVALRLKNEFRVPGA